jgi:hypothetical protein
MKKALFQHTDRSYADTLYSIAFLDLTNEVVPGWVAIQFASIQKTNVFWVENAK